MRSDLEELIKILSKATRQSKPVGIKAHWDGKAWKWEQTLVNPTADEWQPKELQAQAIVHTLKTDRS